MSGSNGLSGLARWRVSVRWFPVLAFAAGAGGAAETMRTDICVFGGTSAGVAAAVQAARMGQAVVLLEAGAHLGGLSSGGLGQTDVGNKAAIGGVAREFYRRVGRRYGRSEAWTFEPSVAESVFFELIEEAGVPVFFEQRLAGVRKADARIVELTTEGGRRFEADIYIDATYEGDLLARAGVSFTVGREPNWQYGETLNGVRAETPKHQFLADVDPYLERGNPASGLLPMIQRGPVGLPGEGDAKVQAYNFRLCLTREPANRRPIDPPRNYRESDFELLARYFDAIRVRGGKPVLGDFIHIQPMPGGKTDINNNGAISTDFIGGNRAYPTADYAARERIRQAHEDYTRGLLHFLATSARVPEPVRREMQSWGLTRDEFRDTDGWPHQLYVREARRMVSDCVVTEINCRESLLVPDPVGLAAYTMDSHNCQRIVRDGRVENEGDVQAGGFPPYPIPYRAIVPTRAECENLLVPVCLSASHIAYGSIRMEPVFMVLGHSAGAAAVLARKRGTPVQAVDPGDLRARLLADGQVLEWRPQMPPAAQTVLDPESRGRWSGIVIDDAEAERTLGWYESGSTQTSLVGGGYVHDWNHNKGLVALTYRPVLPEAGEYEIWLASPPASNRAERVPVTVAVEGGKPITLYINQRATGPEGWTSLGRYRLPAGTSTTVTVANRGTEGIVVADGIRFVPSAR